MEFLIMCPNDGAVEVGLENIGSIIVRGDENVDVVFLCPRCGHQIRVSAQVPRLLMATLADTMVFDEETGEATLSVSALIERGKLLAENALPVVREIHGQITPWTVPASDEDDVDASDERIDRYCEYFRRQLEEIVSAEAMLEEFGGEAPAA